MRIKNLAEEYLNTTIIYKFEEDIKFRANENIGAPMVYDICQCIQEQLQNSNEKVLSHFEKIHTEEKKEAFALTQPKSYSIDPTSFTPVTKETFLAWTIKYKERVSKEKV